MFTSHGHQIIGTTAEKSDPNMQVARCGGPGLCSWCSQEALQALNEVAKHSDIESRFGFHKATLEGPEATQPKHTYLREVYKQFARTLDEKLPDSREKSLAMTHLEEASMWSHKAIAQSAPLESNG